MRAREKMPLFVGLRSTVARILRIIGHEPGQRVCCNAFSGRRRRHIEIASDLNVAIECEQVIDVIEGKLP